MTSLKRLALLLLCTLLLLPAAPTAAAPAQDGPNLLTNPGFESPYVKQCCHTEANFLPNTPIDEVQVAEGWRGWWLPPDIDVYHPSRCETDNCTAWHRPEWREANCGDVCANRVHSGGNAQKYFTFYSVHDAGMYQQVGGITPGARLRFSVYMQAWTNSTNSLISDRNQPMNMRVGIDPNGGADPFSGNVIWSGVFDSYDVYSLYSIEAVARNSTVTVFTRSAPLWGVQHNDIYIDDASLVVVGAGTTVSAPPPVTSAAPTQAPPGIQYVVVPGDNYYRVARKFGISLTALFQANPTATPNLLRVGQVLFIPGVTGGGSTTPVTTAPGGTTTVVPTPTSAPPANAFAYVVQRGDNLYRLSIRFNTTIARIMELNHLTGYIIYIGQTLIIAP